MMFNYEDNPKRHHSVHHHVMQKTLFISLLTMHPMVEEESIKSHATCHVDNPYDRFFHYSVDKTKRQKIEGINKKYALNPCHESLRLNVYTRSETQENRVLWDRR